MPTAAVERGDARGIVAAVLQPLQALDQTRRGGRAAHDADDAAHGLNLWFHGRASSNRRKEGNAEPSPWGQPLGLDCSDRHSRLQSRRWNVRLWLDKGSLARLLRKGSISVRRELPRGKKRR